jgi:hypothetical protein
MTSVPMPGTRPSDAERDRALAVLRDGAGSGRLSHDTFVRRMNFVLRAQSRGELADAIRDLPRPESRTTTVLRRLRSRVVEAAARTGALAGLRQPGPSRPGLSRSGLSRFAGRRRAEGGRALLFGWSGGAPITFTPEELMRRGLTVGWAIGARMARHLREYEAAAVAETVAGRWHALTTTFPLSAAGAAHNALENRETTGKVVLLP